MVLHRFGRASSGDDRLMFSEARPVAESGRGLPHSKTLARQLKHRCGLREVLECASPLALGSGLAEGISASSLRRHVRWPKAVEVYRTPRRWRDDSSTGADSARFWSAPVLWRFDRAVRNGPAARWFRSPVRWPKAVEDYRTPKRWRDDSSTGADSARFWSASVLWRFGRGVRRE